MKLLSRAVVLVLLPLVLMGCGGGSPGARAKQFLTSLDKGQIDNAMDVISPEFRKDFGEAKIRTVLTKASEEMKAQGGLESVTVDKEEINGQVATVTMTVKEKGKPSKTSTMTMNKVGGKWYMGDDKGLSGKTNGAMKLRPEATMPPPPVEKPPLPDRTKG